MQAGVSGARAARSRMNAVHRLVFCRSLALRRDGAGSWVADVCRGEYGGLLVLRLGRPPETQEHRGVVHAYHAQDETKPRRPPCHFFRRVRRRASGARRDGGLIGISERRAGAGSQRPNNLGRGTVTLDSVVDWWRVGRRRRELSIAAVDAQWSSLVIGSAPMKVCLKCQASFPDPATTTCDRDGSELYPELAEYTRDQSKLAGCVLGGRYVVRELLGEGGMGIVLRANHVFLNRDVAIKVLHPELTMVEDVRNRFLREAQAASAIRHPNIVEVMDFGLTHRGLSYLVMEHLLGDTLFSYYSARERLDAGRAAELTLQICDALGALHAGGFVHRDLKPENIWVGPADGTGATPTVKLLDFGIVGVVGDTNEKERLTRTGLTVGTPNYMSPEQVRADATDGRADIYSLGVILWEVVTGKTAVPGGSAIDILTRQLLGEIPPPSSVVPSIPAWFDTIVLRCVAKSPDERFQSAAELKAALVQGLAGEAVGATATPPRPLKSPVEIDDVVSGSAPTIATDAFALGHAAGEVPVSDDADTGAFPQMSGAIAPDRATVPPTAKGQLTSPMGERPDLDELMVPRRRRSLISALAVFGVLAVATFTWSQTGAGGADESGSTAGPSDPAIGELNPDVPVQPQLATNEVAAEPAAEITGPTTVTDEAAAPLVADEAEEGIAVAVPATVVPVATTAVPRREGAVGSALERRGIDLVSTLSAKATVKPKTRPTRPKVGDRGDKPGKTGGQKPVDKPATIPSSPLMEPK
ncbi:MAG: serine/threonine protein kinase [Myxococcota bacterium]|jgi:serine/threonine protein kinase